MKIVTLEPILIEVIGKNFIKKKYICISEGNIVAVTIAKGVIQMTSAGDGVSGRPVPDVRVNPDGSWVTNPATLVQHLQQRVNSITIDPSGAWAVVLTNQDGSVVWSGEGTATSSFFTAGIWDFNGIVLKTATNITRITMTFDYIQW